MLTAAEAGDLKTALSHVLWLGGATDAGKTTSSRLFAKYHGLTLYNYDQRDEPQARILALTRPEYQHIFDGSVSIDERWLWPSPEEKAQHSRQTFYDRFPMVITELLSLPRDRPILAEGFGLIPELLAPIMSCAEQAIFFISSEDFKMASMKRRNKPGWKNQSSNPQMATQKFFERDMRLASLVYEAALLRGFKIIKVDGSQSPEDLRDILSAQFAPWLG